MPVTIRIAFRNLLEHKAKSVIVGSLLALGVIILILGNAFLEASAIGIRRSFTENYTGDVIITGKANGPVSIFGVQSMGGREDTPTIPEYEKILARLDVIDGVKARTAMTSGFGRYIRGDEGDEAEAETGEAVESPHGEADAGEEVENQPGNTFAFFFGIDAFNYWEVFTHLELVSGSMLRPGQQGIMISSDNVQAIERLLKRPVGIGDEILIQGFSSAGMRLRSLPLVGIFKPMEDGVAPKEIAYMDIDNLRVINNMTVGANEALDLTEAKISILSTDDFDSLFADDSFGFDVVTDQGESQLDLDSILGDTSRRELLNTADTGAWHSLLVRVQGGGTQRIIAELNQWFAAEGIQATAGDWKVAAGPYATSVDMLRIIFTVLVIILAVVVIIIIMNTLIVSIIERTGEIGTMRAIGATKGFVRKLFIAETSVLASSFGLIGMIVAFIANGIIWLLRIPATNEFLGILFGGNLMRPVITPGSIAGSLALIVAVGMVAHIYPVTVALRIQPVRAMQSE